MQAQGITAADPISWRVVVGAALGGEFAKVILVDPPSTPLGDRPSAGSGNSRSLSGAETTNLTADMVKRAARKMRRTIPLDETIFRAPGLEIRLTREEYKEDKRHGWINISD